jgi:hypothetical protein
VLSERRDAAAELCTRDAVQSAAQSCAELAVAVGPSPQAQPDAARLELAARQKQQSKALPAREVQPRRPEAALLDVAEQLAARSRQTVSRREPQILRASPPEESQPQAAARAAVQPESRQQAPGALPAAALALREALPLASQQLAEPSDEQAALLLPSAA